MKKFLTVALAGVLAASMPVSYTHLDVYKRQVLRLQNYDLSVVDTNRFMDWT